MADVLGMHADLVGAAGFDADFAIGMPAAPLQHAEVAQRRLAIAMHLHVPFPALAQADVQRRIHAHHAVGHAPHQQRQVPLLDPPRALFAVLAQQRLQFRQRRTLLGHHQQAGGVAIQPVDQFQGLVRPQRAHGFDGAMADAAAAMAGHPGRLVDDQQTFVLEDDGRLHALQEAGRRCRPVAGFAGIDRRDADLVAPFQLALRLGPATVHPHLAAAHQLVDQAAWGPLQLAQQEVVQPLPGPVFRHRDGAHGGLGRCSRLVRGGARAHER